MAHCLRSPVLQFPYFWCLVTNIIAVVNLYRITKLDKACLSARLYTKGKLKSMRNAPMKTAANNNNAPNNSIRAQDGNNEVKQNYDQSTIKNNKVGPTEHNDANPSPNRDSPVSFGSSQQYPDVTLSPDHRRCPAVDYCQVARRPETMRSSDASLTGEPVSSKEGAVFRAGNGLSLGRAPMQMLESS